MPLRSEVHIDKLLTNLLIGSRNEAYIADDVVPAVFSAQSSGKIARMDNSHYRLDFAARATGAPGFMVEWGADSVAFSSDEWRLEHPIDDKQRVNFDSPFDANREAAMVLMDKIWLKKEDLAATLMNTVSNYASGHEDTPGNLWDTATGVPITDINTAIETIVNKTGVGLSNMHGFCSLEVFNHLRTNPQITAIYSSTIPGASGMRMLSQQAVADALGLASLSVGTSVKMTSRENATEVLAPVWTRDNFGIFYKAPTTGIMVPGFAYQVFPKLPGFAGAQVAVDRYRDESRSSDIVRARIEVDQVVTKNTMAYLWTGVIT